jgi:hypothetical protein
MTPIKRFFLLSSLLISIHFPLNARADLLIEPALGSASGRLNFDLGKESTSGMNIGGRLGYQKNGFQFGLDYLGSFMFGDDDDVDNLSISSSDWAAFTGYQFPHILRIYGGYIFKSIASYSYNFFYDDYGDSRRVELENGYGPMVGVSFTELPLININFEIRQVSWDKYNSDNYTVNKKITHNTYLVSVSFPITL